MHYITMINNMDTSKIQIEIDNNNHTNRVGYNDNIAIMTDMTIRIHPFRRPNKDNGCNYNFGSFT